MITYKIRSKRKRYSPTKQVKLSRGKIRRRSYRRKRRYSKKGMTKRRLLNITSRKKRNGMLTWSNTTNVGATQTIGQGNAYVNGAQAGYFLWSPTAMDLNPTASVRNPALRTASTIYAKGLSEHIRMQSSSGIPWFHRRICFTHRGASPFNAISGSDTPVQPLQPYLDTSNGIERLFFNSTINNNPVTLAAQQGIIFKGAQNVDWSDFIIAPLDTTLINVKFDKTWTMQSGNANGFVRERKLWHPMGHNLVYNEDESGETETSSFFSTSSNAGMGDYYVLDLFSAGASGTTTDVLLIAANSTMYWHEK